MLMLMGSSELPRHEQKLYRRVADPRKVMGSFAGMCPNVWSVAHCMRAYGKQSERVRQTELKVGGGQQYLESLSLACY